MAADWVIPVAVSLGLGLPLLLYVGLSLLFSYKPTLLHKSKRLQNFRAKNVSHRGGGGEKLEGTMSAFSNAIKNGSDVLEFDVRLTNDDEVVVFHDATLDRCCGDSRAVKDVKYEDLPQMKPPLGLYYQKGHKTYGDDGRILKLREVFSHFSDTPMIIEIKEKEEQLVQKVSDTIKEFGRTDRTIWGSEDDITSEMMYKQNPDIALFFSYKAGVMMLLKFYTGLLPFVPVKQSVLMAPMPAIELDPENGFQHDCCKRLKVWLTDKAFMSKRMFSHLAARGIDTYLFVLNKDSEYDRAFKDLNVTGALTDFPSRLSAYLKRSKYITPQATDNLL